MRNWDWEIITESIVVTVCVTVLAAVIFFVALYPGVIAPWWCDRVAEDYGLQDAKTRWGTCFVQLDDGTWIREENYRVVKE